MSRHSRTTTCLLLAAAVCCAPATGLADGYFAPSGQNSSASLDFRIVIPPVMRVIENSHPTQIDGDQPVEQRLVVLSNMKHGFCASLRVQDPALAGWRLQTDETGGVTLQAVDGGYRLCTSRPGRYTLRLQHDFSASSTQARVAWPVQTELMAL